MMGNLASSSSMACVLALLIQLVLFAGLANLLLRFIVGLCDVLCSISDCGIRRGGCRSKHYGCQYRCNCSRNFIILIKRYGN